MRRMELLSVTTQRPTGTTAAMRANAEEESFWSGVVTRRMCTPYATSSTTANHSPAVIAASPLRALFVLKPLEIDLGPRCDPGRVSHRPSLLRRDAETRAAISPTF